MFWLDVVSRITHIATAIVLIGGSSFVGFILLPASNSLSDQARQELTTAVVSRWKRFVHAGILLFLLSGFYNFYQAFEMHRGDGLYHALVGTKILLAFAIFFIVSALVGKSPRFEFMRQARRKWISIMLITAAVIVCISGFVKVRGPVTETADDSGLTQLKLGP